MLSSLTHMVQNTSKFKVHFTLNFVSKRDHKIDIALRHQLETDEVR